MFSLRPDRAPENSALSPEAPKSCVCRHHTPGMCKSTGGGTWAVFSAGQCLVPLPLYRGGMGAPAAPFGPAEVEWYFWGMAENYATAVPQGPKLFHAAPFALESAAAPPPRHTLSRFVPVQALSPGHVRKIGTGALQHSPHISKVDFGYILLWKDTPTWWRACCQVCRHVGDFFSGGGITFSIPAK
jgi:hypothetical protein